MGFKSAFLLAVFMAATSFNNSFAVNIEKEKRDQCIKDSRQRYDECIELAIEMEKNDVDRTQEYKLAQKLRQGDCLKQFNEDMKNCQHSIPLNGENKSINSDPKTNPDLRNKAD